MSKILIGTLAAALVSFAGAADAVTTNAGGVLLLHVEGPYELGSYDMCSSLSLESWDQAVTSVPGDGKPYLIGCYAAFPPDSTAKIQAVSFGVRYSPGVRVVSLGACNGGLIVIPGNEWPASGGGIGIPFLEDNLKVGNLSTIHWFAVQSNEPGFFEVVPHPVYNLAGTFASETMPPRSEPITGYGRIGFGQEGYLPQPGEQHHRGACCTPAGCWVVSRLECDHYEGVFLGVGVTCESGRCGDSALKGGCCLPHGCEEHTWLDCKLLGGHFLGEMVHCDSIPCPDPDDLTPEGF